MKARLARPALRSAPRGPVSSGARGLAVAALLAGCSSQLWAPPIEATVDPLPPGATERWAEGPEEVSIVRHASPVKVRPADLTGGIPLPFYEKTQRVHAGAGVIVDAGGRAEVVWPMGTSILMNGPAGGVVGSPSRGEPMFHFEDLGRARLILTDGDQVRLVGGALLVGSSGPYLLERVGQEIVRVRNQSKEPLLVSFRTADFEIGPGQQVELPLVSSGGQPIAGIESYRTISGPGFGVDVRGAVESLSADAAVRLRAEGEHAVEGLGVRLELAPGEEAVFSGLGDEATRDG